MEKVLVVPSPVAKEYASAEKKFATTKVA